MQTTATQSFLASQLPQNFFIGSELFVSCR